MSAAKKIAAMNQISRLSDIFTTISFTTINSARMFRRSAKCAISSPVGSDKRPMAEFVRPSAYLLAYLLDHLSRKRIDPEQIREKKSAGSNSPVRRNVINIQRVGLCAFYRYC